MFTHPTFLALYAEARHQADVNPRISRRTAPLSRFAETISVSWLSRGRRPLKPPTTSRDRQPRFES
jgi:hypothetical protein